MAFQVNVPNVPGVPSVAFAPGSGVLPILMTADASPLFGAAFQQWGLYSGGAAIVTADTVMSFDYRQQWSLSDYPVEQGAFETYDKVQLPFDVRLRFVAGGAASRREALLESIAAIAGDYNLYTAIMPEASYPSVNITHYDFTRTTRNGVSLMQVDVWALEVRTTVFSTNADTAAPSGASQQNTGPVQSVGQGSISAGLTSFAPTSSGFIGTNNAGFGSIPANAFANAPSLT